MQTDSSTITKHYVANDPILIRFFENLKFISKLTKFLLKAYNVTCQIAESEPNQNGVYGLRLTFNGDIKQNVTNAREFSKTLFTSIQKKIYNNCKTDKKGIAVIFLVVSSFFMRL